MSVNKIYPWTLPLWNSLWQQPEKLHHALLLMGPEGVGKGRFADAMAARLLCEQPHGTEACGGCDACRWLAGGNHPDFRRVTLESDETDESEEGAKPAKASKAVKVATQIKIGQIRGLEDFIFVGSHRQGRRVVIIDPADTMNPAAANALLKVLEEPPANVYFLLVSSNSSRLLPTLRSRCRKIGFGLPETAPALAWLREQGVAKGESLLSLAGGAPIKAMAMGADGSQEGVEKVLLTLQSAGDPVGTAAQWDALMKSHARIDAEALVDTLQKWLHDLMRVRLGAAPRYLPSQGNPLGRIAAQCDPARLHRFHGELLKIRATARHPLNPQLFLEDIAARYLQAVAPR